MNRKFLSTQRSPLPMGGHAPSAAATLLCMLLALANTSDARAAHTSGKSSLEIRPGIFCTNKQDFTIKQAVSVRSGWKRGSASGKSLTVCKLGGILTHKAEMAKFQALVNLLPIQRVFPASVAKERISLEAHRYLCDLACA